MQEVSPLQKRLERIWVIAKTDYTQRYYGSALGMFWALINPIFRILVFYFIFTFLVFRNREPDFILYLFLGISLWTYFSENTNKGLGILNQKKYLIQNIEINKIDLFLSSAISTSFAFFLNILVYLGFSLFFDLTYSFEMGYIFLIFGCLMIMVIGVSMILSSAFLYFKDLKHFWDMAMMLGFWTIPIIWDYKLVLTEYPLLLYLNPLTGILINMRNILLFNLPFDWGMFGYDLMLSLCLLGIGIFSIKNFSHKAVEIQ